MKAYTVCARAQHLFLWSSGHSVKKTNCQIVEEVWTMTEQVGKSKDLKRQINEWMAVFSQNVWEILSKSYIEVYV